MVVQKFETGQTVKLIPGPYIRNHQGEFAIRRVLPEEHGCANTGSNRSPTES